MRSDQISEGKKVESRPPTMPFKVVDMAREKSSEVKPDESWDLDRLGKFIVSEIGVLQSLARKTAIHTWRVGQALSIAHTKAREDGVVWEEFLEEQGISVTTDWRARKLAKEPRGNNWRYYQKLCS